MAGYDRLTPEGKKFYDELKKLKEQEVFIGYQSGEVTDDRGVDMAQIAMFNELGTSSSPSRPFLRQTVDDNKDKIIKMTLLPEYIEYSEKDDKFRLIASGRRHGATLNIARIIKCTPYNRPFEAFTEKAESREPEKVEFELYDRRNALERVLMHFAHFEKQAEKTGEDKYKVTIFYDKNDETEIVIRILSFGPMIKVTAPGYFIELIKDRLLRQKNCGH